MNSAMISKIEKARRYAEEPERVRIHELEVDFNGDHASYVVSMNGTSFSDSSPGFQSTGTSAHIMALQRLLHDMLTEDQQTSGVDSSALSLGSTYVSKIEKSRRYAEEPDRVKFRSFKATIRGGHDDHHVSMTGEEFQCSCHFFEGHGTCSHVMAMQRILGDMLSEEQLVAGQPFSFSEV